MYILYIYILYIYILYIWVNYNDLTATSLGMMVSRGDYPQMTLFQVSELLQFAHIYIYIPCFVFWRVHGIMFGTLSDLLKPKKSSVETKLNMDQ